MVSGAWGPLFYVVEKQRGIKSLGGLASSVSVAAVQTSAAQATSPHCEGKLAAAPSTCYPAPTT